MLFFFCRAILFEGLDLGCCFIIIAIFFVLYSSCFLVFERFFLLEKKPVVGWFLRKGAWLSGGIDNRRYFCFVYFIFFIFFFFLFYGFFVINLLFIYFNLRIDFFFFSFDLMSVKAYFIFLSYVIIIFNFCMLGFLYNRFFFHDFFRFFNEFTYLCHISHFLCLFLLDLPCWLMLVDYFLIVLLFVKRPIVYYIFDGLLRRRAVTKLIKKGNK